MSNSFLFMYQSPILTALRFDYLKVDDIYQFLASFDYSKTSLYSFLLFPLELLSHLLCYL